jgi:uroporphyrinogen decarboxylase
MNPANDLLLRAAAGQPTERIPVWLMRQAGRILPEYRALRASVSGFLELVRTPELVCEVTMQPVRALGVDAAIIFSDILVIPEAMGLPYTMVESVGPRFENPLRSRADIERLRVADPADLAYVTEGIRLTRAALNNSIPLIGFAGAPWTIMAYMVEGGGSKTFSHARRMLYTEPLLSGRLLDMITEGTIAYLKAQVAAGAQLVQLFDSWAGVLAPAQYRAIVLPRMQAICQALHGVPVTVFAKDAWFALPDLATLDCQVLGLDWQQEPAWALAHARGKVLQGNLDPCLLYADPETIARKTLAMLRAFPNPHIANLGHGVYPDTPLEGVRAFIETVKGYEPGKA